MKAPPYPLQALLDLRERAKEAAKKAFGEAVRALDNARGQLEALEAERQRIASEREQHRARLYEPDETGLLAIATIEMRRDSLRSLAERLERQETAVRAQEQEVRDAESAVEMRKSELVATDQGVQAIEKHREKWLAEIKKEAERRDQRLSEEISQSQFVREQSAQAEEEDTDEGSHS